jgi:hypothetical protein
MLNQLILEEVSPREDSSKEFLSVSQSQSRASAAVVIQRAFRAWVSGRKQKKDRKKHILELKYSSNDNYCNICMTEKQDVAIHDAQVTIIADFLYSLQPGHNNNKNFWVQCKKVFTEKLSPLRKSLLFLLNQMNNSFVSGSYNDSDFLYYSPLLEDILSEVSDVAIQKKLEIFSRDGEPWEKMNTWIEEVCHKAQLLYNELQNNTKK